MVLHRSESLFLHYEKVGIIYPADVNPVILLGYHANAVAQSQKC